MKESDRIKKEMMEDNSDNDYRDVNYLRKIERAERKEKFEDKWLQALLQKTNVLYEARTARYEMFHPRLGTLYFYPKANRILIRAENKWYSRGLQWLIKNFELNTTENRMPLSKAKAIAERFCNYLTPFCSQISIAGSVRRECDTVGDIEFVVIAKDEFSMGQAFPLGYPGLTINGARLKKFYYPASGLHMELYITTQADFGRILAIRTGSSAFSHIQLAIRWNRLSWVGTEDGLRRKSECIKKSTWKIKPEYKGNPTLPPPFKTEKDFFAFLSIPWVHPRERSWVSQHEEINYKL